MKDCLDRVCTSEKVVVCVFADRKYTRVLVNWLKHVRKVTDVEPVVFCLDDETQAVCTSVGAENILYPYHGTWLGFMHHQMRATLEMLELGYSPLITGIDAIWVRDPVPFTLHHHQDMVFSPGTIQPLTAHAKCGNVLCTGYFLLRSTRATIEIIEELLPLMETEGDQPAINNLLVRKGLDFTRPELYPMPFMEKEILQSRDTRTGSVDGLSVAMMPNRYFQRLEEKDEPDPMVIHPIADKTQEAKISVLSGLGIWVE